MDGGPEEKSLSGISEGGIYNEIYVHESYIMSFTLVMGCLTQDASHARNLTE